MNDRVFIDTNVLVYTVSTDINRQQQARQVVATAPELVLSAQILSEFVNVCLRQDLLEADQLEAVVDGFTQAYQVVPVDAVTIHRALALQRRYGYSWWDSVMLSSALLADCAVVYTEDLHDGQVLEGSLRIENPFR